MTKLQIINGVTRAFHKAEFAVKKHSPEILMVAGVVGVVTSAVMACKATTKLSGILDEAKETVDIIHSGMETGVIHGTEYSKEDGKKDLTITYAQTGLKIAKLYAPAIILGALSLTSVIASNNILRARNVALAAAYTTLDNGFKDYRKRVVERFGEELDRELKYNIKAKEVEEVVIDEKGKEKTVKKTVEVINSSDISPYAVVYDDGCTGWSKDPEMNKFFLLNCQNMANEKLRTEGHLFLNEVYEMLGFKQTLAGHSVGWIYDEKNPVGDNYVDFGLVDIHDERKRAFLNGYERNILLDFNVDGPIYNLIF